MPCSSSSKECKNKKLMSGKFNFCFEADGLMWCQFLNGKWARPWPATSHSNRQTKIPKPLKRDDEIIVLKDDISNSQ